MVRKYTIVLHLHFEVRFYKKKKIKLKLQKKRNYINFCPHLTSFKQNYITARRSVKKRILQRSGEGNQLTENNDNQGETEEVE